jgi:hypothetical protein
MLPPRIIILIVLSIVLVLIIVSVQIWTYWYTRSLRTHTRPDDETTGNHIPLQPVPRQLISPIVQIGPIMEYTNNNNCGSTAEEVWEYGEAL